jgi:hypothetical protein
MNEFALKWLLIFYIYDLCDVLKLNPNLAISMEEFISQSFDLLNIASINKNTCKGPA